jgi:ribosomal protein RSM22 (predicted rRNA methylase)
MSASARAPVRAAQMAMSTIYRDGGHSRLAVPDATAALAYAVARMPATYAACVRAFDLTAQRNPHLAPRRILDIGSGPGTATLAAGAVWSTLATAQLLEPNAALADIARHMLAASDITGQLQATDLATFAASSSATPADLVTLSYVLAEQPDAQIAQLVTGLVPHVAQAIIIVEPGTPQGYTRILLARDALIASGLTILAPCPHAAPCPLPAGDWCHFSVRLQRSAAHMGLKDASVPFEDERFSFVAAVRPPAALPLVARLIRPQTVEKGFADLALCTPTGLETRRVPRRNKPAYKAAKSLDWGDEV